MGNLIAKTPSGRFMIINHARHMNRSGVWHIPVVDTFTDASTFKTFGKKSQYVIVSNQHYNKLRGY